MDDPDGKVALGQLLSLDIEQLMVGGETSVAAAASSSSLASSPSSTTSTSASSSSSSAAVAGALASALSRASPRVGEGSGVWVEDLEAEKKRYLTQKQKKKRDAGRNNSKLSLREFAEGGLSSSSSTSSSSSGTLSSSSSVANGVPAHAAEGADGSSGTRDGADDGAGGARADDDGALMVKKEQPNTSDSSGGAAEAEILSDEVKKVLTKKLMNDEDEDPFECADNDEDDDKEETEKEEWERTREDKPVSDSQDQGTISTTDPSSGSEGAAMQSSSEDTNTTERDGAKGNNIFSHLKSFVGNLSSKVATSRDEDDEDDDENEDVWDELRVRTLRNTLVNKHMSHLDLNSKQIELVNVKAEAWEDVFKGEEPRQEEDVITQRSAFSRWDVQNETLLSMLLAIRLSAAASEKRQSATDEINATEFKTCRSCSLTVGGLGTKITTKDYAPLVFNSIRLISGVTCDDFLKAWSDSRIGSEEDDDEIIAYSMDRRFIMQRITSDQAKVLANILPAYYMYIKANPQSMIERYFGLHQVGTRGKKIYFTVLGNVFGSRTARQLKECFSVREPQTEERRHQRRDSFGNPRSRSRNATLDSTGTSPMGSPGTAKAMPKRAKARTSLPVKKNTTRASPNSSDGEGPLTHHSDSFIPVSTLPMTMSSDSYGILAPPSDTVPASLLAATSSVPRSGSHSPSESPSTSPYQTRRRRTLLGFLSRNVDLEGSTTLTVLSQEARPLDLTSEQQQAFLKQLDNDIKWLAQAGLSSYVLTVGVSSTPSKTDSSPNLDKAVRVDAVSVPSMVCFLELPNREVKKANKYLHEPPSLDQPPRSPVLKMRNKPTSPPVPKRPPGKTKSGDQASKADSNRSTAPLSYHVGIPGFRKQQKSRERENKQGELREAPVATSVEDSGDDDMGFFLHLRQGAQKMNQQLGSTGAQPPDTEPVIGNGIAENEGSGPREKKKRKKKRSKERSTENGTVATGEGEPSTEPKVSEENNEDAVQFHLSLTDILHKHATRGLMWGKVMGGGNTLTATQYAQSLYDTIAEKLIVSE